MGKRKYGGRRAAVFIFDLDGTLIDSGLDIARSANFVRGRFDREPLPIETVVSYVGDGVPTLMQRVLGHDGPPPDEETAAEALAVFREHYGRHCLDNTTVFPGVLDVLRHFSRFPLMVATNKPRAFTDQILDGVALSGAFARIVAGDEVPRRKPHPDHLLACLAGREVAPEEVVVVGDSPNDVLPARELGFRSVAATFGLVDAGRLRAAEPDHLIDDISELKDLFPSRT